MNPGGQKEVTIRKYGVEQIEIIVPEVDEAEVQRIERIISTTRQSRVPHPGQQPQQQGADRAGQAEPTKMQIRDSTGNLLAWWVPVKEGEERSFASYPEIARRTRKVGKREVRKSSS